MKWIGTICLLAAAAMAAADFSWLDVALSQPILQPRQATMEAQVHFGSRVKPIPPIADRTQWDHYAQTLRTQILDRVVFRGEAATWRDLPTNVEWLDALPGNGYRVVKFRYEVIPGLWLPGLLYEPSPLKPGRTPVVINVNGHEGEGTATPYIQERCINLAKKGVLAYNYEWFGMGQMAAPGYAHARLNQIDLTGTSGLAPFFLAQKRLIDIALQHPNADPGRLAVTGLSGGGWQTIFVSALDPRVKLAMPVAGYSSFVTRTQFPEMDLGDSEQTPVDLGQFADYTHLTAMLAPRPLQIANNARDNCCFRADYAQAPLLVAARPIFALYDAPDRLRGHTNFDPGHNYGLENQEAFFAFLKEFFFADDAGFSIRAMPVPNEIRTAAQLRVPLPANNADLHTVAVRLSRNLTPSGPPTREKLREIVRWPDYRATGAHPITLRREGDVVIRATRLSLENAWTVPLLELTPPESTGTTLVMADAGKATLANEIQQLLESKRRVVTIDPFYFGESRMESRDYLYALLASSLGERPLGIEAGQVAAAARWLKEKYGPVSVVAYGPRTSLIAEVAAAIETDAIAGWKTVRPLTSLRDPILRDMTVIEAPELFCFGLLESFDLQQLAELARR